MKLSKTDIKDVIALEIGCIVTSIFFYAGNHIKTGNKAIVKATGFDELLLLLSIIIILVFPMLFMVVYKGYKLEAQT